MQDDVFQLVTEVCKKHYESAVSSYTASSHVHNAGTIKHLRSIAYEILLKNTGKQTDAGKLS